MAAFFVQAAFTAYVCWEVFVARAVACCCSNITPSQVAPDTLASQPHARCHAGIRQHPEMCALLLLLVGLVQFAAVESCAWAVEKGHCHVAMCFTSVAFGSGFCTRICFACRMLVILS